MSEQDEFTHTDDAAEALMILHDRSMSKDGLKACEGRLGKVLVNAVMPFIEQEGERRTNPADLVFALVSFGMSGIFTAIVNSIPPEGQVHVAEILREAVIKQYDSSLEELKRLREED